jgi:hypothetical protein
MNADPFDAVITLNDHHLEAAGLTGRKGEAVAAVRQAVERMDGAGWIDVEIQSYPPGLPGWAVVYPRGRCGTPQTPAWCERRHQVERQGQGAIDLSPQSFESHTTRGRPRPPSCVPEGRLASSGRTLDSAANSDHVT